MTKYVFIKHPNPDNEFDNTRIEFTVEGQSIPEIIESFEDFLRGCGFVVSGKLEIVEER